MGKLLHRILTVIYLATLISASMLRPAGANTAEEHRPQLQCPILSSSLAAPPAGPVEIIVIDDAVLDFQVFETRIRPGVEIVRLNAYRDGLSQISSALVHRRGVTVLHIISHGAPGRIYLGDSELNNGNIGLRAAEFEFIGQALAPGGSILLYGCNVARGESGNRFIRRVARLANAEVAASTDFTGASSKGGNWVLERQTGAIQSDRVLNFPDYQDLLYLGDSTHPHPDPNCRYVKEMWGGQRPPRRHERWALPTLHKRDNS